MTHRTESVPATPVQIPAADPATPNTTTNPVTTLDPNPAAPAAVEQPATLEAPGDAAAQRAAEQAAVAQALAEEAEQRARQEADATLKAAVKSYRAGEKAYRAGLLEAGRLADVYVFQRLVLGDKRAAAVQTLEGELAKYSSTTVDANRLVACYQASHLLGDGLLDQLDTASQLAAEADDKAAVKAANAAYKAAKEALERVPYGHYRDAWSRLVQRTAKDTPQESWVLLPGLESDCREAFAKAVTDGLSKAAVEELARTLVTHAEAAAAEAARQAKGAAEAEARKAELEAARQRQELATANAKAEQAAKAAAEAEKAGATAEAKAELTANMEAARKQLLEQQQATIAAEEQQRQAEAAKARAEAEAKATAKRQAEAEAKAAAKKAKADAKDGTDKPATVDASSTPAAPKQQPAPESRPTLGNLLQAAKAAGKAGVAKDVAEMAAELVTGSEAPDDVLEQLLTILAAHPEMGKASHRACQAALVVLKRAESPAPAAVAAALEPKAAEHTAGANGTLTASAA
jgi:colicin import membrane protein